MLANGAKEHTYDLEFDCLSVLFHCADFLQYTICKKINTFLFVFPCSAYINKQVMIARGCLQSQHQWY